MDTVRDWRELFEGDNIGARQAQQKSLKDQFACLRQSAVTEDVDMKASRGLDKALFQKLVVGDWIDRHQNLRAAPSEAPVGSRGMIGWHIFMRAHRGAARASKTAAGGFAVCRQGARRADAPHEVGAAAPGQQSATRPLRQGIL